MTFKEIILKMLEAELDASNGCNIAMDADLWNEVYNIMLLLSKLYGSTATKEILQKLADGEA